MSYKNGENTHTFDLLKGQIVQDAERLDAIGAIGIGRTFAYGGATGKLLYSSAKDVEDVIQHFYDKLLLLENKMNTLYGKMRRKKDTNLWRTFLLNFIER